MHRTGGSHPEPQIFDRLAGHLDWDIVVDERGWHTFLIFITSVFYGNLGMREIAQGVALCYYMPPRWG
jgi:hypothetical protein